MTIGAARNVARRQLIGSIGALFLVAAFAVIAGLRSSQVEVSANEGRGAWAVQSPTYLAPEDRIVAAKQGRVFERPVTTR